MVPRSTHDYIFSRFRSEVAERVLSCAVHAGLEVEMVSERLTGVADLTDHVAARSSGEAR